MALRDAITEVLELGLGATVARARWELRARTGLVAKKDAQPLPPRGERRVAVLPFAEPTAVAEVMRAFVPTEQVREEARRAMHGEIVAFGGRPLSYGDPIDWLRDPESGRVWDSSTHWTSALAANAGKGDVKRIWEIGRFPHAFTMARAAAYFPEDAEALRASLLGQIRSFLAENPLARGLHWASGLEVAYRLVAWLFASHVLGFRDAIEDALWTHAAFIERHLEFARDCVPNDHLVGEALAIFLAGFPAGRKHLIEEASTQIYDDGGYFMYSNTYHRAVLQMLLVASMLERNETWLAAMRRSLSFLYAQQNGADGQLPNHGGNDGGSLLPLSSASYNDFRPVLQAVSIATEGERLYDAGPHDELAAWLFGAQVLDLPRARRDRRSVSFRTTGMHVLRADDEHFAAFRCGTVRERYGHIDQLHVDLWWRGQNVLADSGSYSYNESPQWHAWFVRTASHNTVVVDGRDQMLHYRQFKVVHFTPAELDAFEPARVAGHHDGWKRELGVTHRREVVMGSADVWVVRDRVEGTGEHEAVLHWLCGPFPWRREGEAVVLETPRGDFAVAVFAADGRPLPIEVEEGWLSRTYSTRLPVPSLKVRQKGPLPLELVTRIGPMR